MSPVQARKRRRSMAFGSTENIEEVLNEEATDEAQHNDRASGATQNEDTDNVAHVWEAFREEYYEVLEQLPLTLHRSFALMHELDEQANVHNNELLRNLLEYIEFRNFLCSRRPVDATLKSLSLAPEGLQLETLSNKDARQPPSTRTSQELLSRIAWLSEEVVRASQEKVNVAQSAYDSADRQIRLLDFAIQEQETSIKLGLKPGAQFLPILSDAAVGRWVRPPREPESIEPGLSDANDAGQASVQGDGVPNLGIVALENTDRPPITAIVRRGKKGKGKKRITSTNSTGPTTLTVTVPPLASVTLQAGDMPVDPNEPRYCYCNQVSFGVMIACDNSSCELEWFHLGCAGLAEVPKGKWYCRNCQASMKSGHSRRAR